MVSRLGAAPAVTRPAPCLLTLHVGCCRPQQVHGGRLLKVLSQAEDDFVVKNLLWTGFFGETCA